MVQDGMFMKDIISDYVIGIVLLAFHQGDIGYHEARVFQSPFAHVNRNGVRVRVCYPHAGLYPSWIRMEYPW